MLVFKNGYSATNAINGEGLKIQTNLKTLKKESSFAECSQKSVVLMTKKDFNHTSLSNDLTIVIEIINICVLNRINTVIFK